MNRKKKINDMYNKKLKKLNAKVRVNNKPKYISKAEREKNIATESGLRIDDVILVGEFSHE